MVAKAWDITSRVGSQRGNLVETGMEEPLWPGQLSLHWDSQPCTDRALFGSLWPMPHSHCIWKGGLEENLAYVTQILMQETRLEPRYSDSQFRDHSCIISKSNLYSSLHAQENKMNLWLYRKNVGFLGSGPFLVQAAWYFPWIIPAVHSVSWFPMFYSIKELHLNVNSA